MIVKVDKQGRIPLKAFENVVDTSKVHSYTVDQEGQALALTFYDKSGEKIIPKDSAEPKIRRAIDEMRNQDIPIPWEVNRFMDLDGKLPVFGDQASLSKNGDYGSLEDMRKCVEWLADQFGGKVKWEDENG
jgi:hypothetical protein